MNETRLGRLLALLAALIAFAIYWLTLAQTVTWLHNGADSGDLAAAAFVFGIPHPPGYPLYTLIASGFARLPFFEPAGGLALFSALAASAAVFVLARAGSAVTSPTQPLTPGFSPKRSGEKEHGEESGEKESSRSGIGVEVLIAPIGALAFGLAPMIWSQAVIPEVYALNLLLVAMILWASVTTNSWRVMIAALAFGLGLAHHLAILLLAPGALLALQPTRRDWKALLVLAAPLVFYVYLPIAALPNPPIKWGDPVMPERFFWLVTAAQYRPYLFAVDEGEVLGRFAFAARALLDQFTFVGVALVVWGALQMAISRRRLFAATMLMFVPVVLYAVLYASRDSFLYLLPAFAVALLWMLCGVANVVSWVGDDRVPRAGAVALFAALPVYNAVTNFATMDVSQDRAAFEYARQNFEGLPVDAVLFADGDRALFALWYYRHAVAYQGARSVIVSQGLLQYDWYYDSLRRTMSEVQFQDPTVVTDAHARAREIMRVTFAEGRAVCFTDSSPLVPEFEYFERGILKCVLAEK
ncbi:MAG: DUF2723 domain-containing protein [Anaerolineae bacterium]|nr:DUF2723 domain-containing protein [Anaerolineae bacterium]